MLTLKFIIIFVVGSIGALMCIMIYSEIEESKVVQITEPDCVNCNVNYNGADCIDCKTEDNSGLVIVGLLPIVLFIALFLIFSNLGEDKLFGGLGGKKPSSSDGWLSIGDFKNG